jgi:hypothetical protein
MLECEHCSETFDDDENTITNYLMHQSVHHKDKTTTIEEEMFEDFRKKMIKQKDEYEKSKEKTGDSDLIFNAKERDA